MAKTKNNFFFFFLSLQNSQIIFYGVYIPDAIQQLKLYKHDNTVRLIALTLFYSVTQSASQLHLRHNKQNKNLRKLGPDG